MADRVPWAIRQREEYLRRAAKIDANHPEMRDMARKLGASWLDCHQLKNACDAFLSYKGQTWAIEVKDGSKPPSARKLTEGEQKFKDMWELNGSYAILETPDDLLTLLGVQSA